MIIGHNFTDQQFTANILGEFIDLFLFNQSGVVRGLNFTASGKNINISQGLMIVKGRMVEIKGTETFAVTNGNGDYKLILELNMRNTNTITKLEQVKLKVVSSTHTNSSENINIAGLVYQQDLCTFTVNGSSITNLKRVIQNITPNGLVKRFDDEMKKVKVENSVVTRTDLNNYVLKSELSKMAVKPKAGTTPPKVADLEDGEIYIQYLN